MARQNTQLEATGAEFLVLGRLLIEGIPAFKAYVNVKGYDLLAVNPETKKLLRVQVKSRWRTSAEGFIIKNFDCDFVVVVLLNRGSKDGKKAVRDPEYFVFPVQVARKWRQSDWGKVRLSGIEEINQYRDAWGQIKAELEY